MGCNVVGPRRRRAAAASSGPAIFDLETTLQEPGSITFNVYANGITVLGPPQSGLCGPTTGRTNPFGPVRGLGQILWLSIATTGLPGIGRFCGPFMPGNRAPNWPAHTIFLFSHLALGSQAERRTLFQVEPIWPQRRSRIGTAQFICVTSIALISA